jgi:hypothetical protein
MSTEQTHTYRVQVEITLTKHETGNAIPRMGVIGRTTTAAYFDTLAGAQGALQAILNIARAVDELPPDRM